MKKVLAAVLAAAMSLSMASVAFAAINGSVGAGSVTGNSSGDCDIDLTALFAANKKISYDVLDGNNQKVHLFNKDSDAVELDFYLGYDGNHKPAYKFSEIDVHVAKGNVKTKKIRLDDGNMRLVISPNYGVRDWEGDKWEVDVEVDTDHVLTLKGEGAYSAVQTVYSGSKLRVSDATSESERRGKDTDADNGVFFFFDEVIEDEARIRSNEYVDVFFKGNYGTDVENMEVSTSVPSEVKEYFDDVDVDCYDFIGTPKFATAVRVVIDADPESIIYQYDKSTGDLTRVDTTAYTSNGWEFKTKNLGCYILTEEEYDEGNAKDEPTKEPVSEPTETPADKSNPGTGANDMVGAAAALAVVSLIAAGAVAFKKASK